MTGFLQRTLPAPLTPLVGRERILESLRVLLRRTGVRLVTLSGPGGVGKTRVALRVAEELAPDFTDGVAFVPLAAITDPDLVPSTIAQVLGVHAIGTFHLLDVLVDTLREREFLLVLDNCEQVVAAAPAVAELLVRCPELKVLATSRMVLRISGEWDLPIPPLALPVSDQRSLQDLRSVEAVRLFVERARAADAAFSLTEENGTKVAEICRRLDGLPLALELAAARLRHLPLDALLARLEPRLPLLAGGPRDQPARLQTMRDAIGWSHDLLSPSGQHLFRWLAVFNGGFTAEAATTVCGDDDELRMLEEIASLVDSSLVQREEPRDQPRYTMLQTVRDYGLERLQASGEAAEIQRRHADWCLALVEQAWPSFAARVGQEPWLERLSTEHDNLRASLGWLIEQADAAAAVRLAGAMFWFWFVRGHASEGRAWFNRVLAMPGSDQVELADRSRALLGAGLLAHFQADDTAAAPLTMEARSLARQSGFAFGQAAACLTLGIIAEDRGDYDDGIPFLDEAIEVCRRSGDRANEALALYHLGVGTWGKGDAAQAVTLCEEALAIQRAIGDRWGMANSLGYLGLIIGAMGDHKRAADLTRESLELRRALGTPEDLANSIANIAALASACNEPALAARLFGAEDALRTSIGSFRKLPERTVFEQAVVATREVLEAEAFAAAWEAGRRLSREQAVELALSFEPVPAAVPGPVEANRRERLTEREYEVLKLLVLGKTNPEIADELYISKGTVRTHVSNILGRLGARTRTEAAELARRRGLL